jgi:glycosyltransferase involved in cell wall biosynthesis
MRKTKLPTALVYGWDRFGEIKLQSDIYFQEGLYDGVIAYSMENDSNFFDDFSKYHPDVIITFNGKDLYTEISKYKDHPYIMSKWVDFQFPTNDVILANDIVCQSTFWSCKSIKEVYGDKETPLFSVFTGAYKTNERIFRTYESLKNQTYPNWEWVVVDDSPEGDYKTWEYLKEIASKDYRVKPHRVSPNSGGNVGEVKHRAAMLCNGTWLVELDHDDALASTTFEDCLNGIREYPDAGFVYSDCTELYEDGTFRQYGPVDPNGYGDWQNNGFTWAYCYHEWVDVDGKKVLGTFSNEINPKTIRYNMGMPNHVRIWRDDVYTQVKGHNRNVSVADDYELIVKTFLVTKFLHIKKVLYLQYNNKTSTVDLNVIDINRRARLIRDYYDTQIHNRIQELGVEDWDWIEEEGHSHQLSWWMDHTRYFDKEGVMNYIYVPKNS